MSLSDVNFRAPDETEESTDELSRRDSDTTEPTSLLGLCSRLLLPLLNQTENRLSDDILEENRQIGGKKKYLVDPLYAKKSL